MKLLVVILNYRVTELTVDCLRSLADRIGGVPGARVAVLENGTGGDAYERLRRAIDENGWGAWELAGRYSFVDMSDGPVEGGEHTAYTLGLNWYANQNIRWTLNYIFNDIENDFYDGNFQVLQSRVQIAF